MGENEKFDDKWRALVAEAMGRGELPPVDVEDVDSVIDIFRSFVRRARHNGQHLISERVRTAMKAAETISTEIIEGEASKQARENATEKPATETPKRGRGAANGGDQAEGAKAHL